MHVRASRLIGCLLSASIFSLACAPASAALLGAEATLPAQANAERARLAALFARQDVQQQLARLGVSPTAAQARVAALSDEEAQQMAARMQQMPAGSDVVSVVIGVAVVLLATDLLGLTHVYSFIHPLR